MSAQLLSSLLLRFVVSVCFVTLSTTASSGGIAAASSPDIVAAADALLHAVSAGTSATAATTLATNTVTDDASTSAAAIDASTADASTAAPTAASPWRTLVPPPPGVSVETAAAATRARGFVYRDALAASQPYSRYWDASAHVASRAAALAQLHAFGSDTWRADSFWHDVCVPTERTGGGGCAVLASYLWNYFAPDGPCPMRTRLGAVQDGGKFVCGVEGLRRAAACVVYSFGVADDVSFEADFLRASNCSVFAFDPTVPAAPSPVERPGDEAHARRFVFNKLGIAGDTHWARGAPYAPLGAIMGTLGHAFVDVLKVDVEGAEWEALIPLFHEWAEAGATPIAQLLVELHTDGVPPWKVDAFFAGAAAAGLLPFSSELNPITCLPHSALQRRPDFVEYSFVHVGNMRARFDV